MHYQDLLVVAAIGSCCPLHRHTHHGQTELAALPTTMGCKPNIDDRTEFSFAPSDASDARFVHWELCDLERAAMIP